MKARKEKYRRLQVDNIPLRTAIEVVMLITAIIISCVVVVNSYEANYAAATIGSAGDSARQLAHSVAAIADVESMSVENSERREFVAERYTSLLDECFIGEDVQYSGAIYSVGEMRTTFFAGSTAYSETIGSGIEEPYPGELEKCLNSASTGSLTSVMLDDDVCVAFVPVTEKETGRIYAVAAGAVDYRTSTEFNSPVRNRLVLISFVSAALILTYFLISGARSEKRKIRGEAV